MPLATTEGRPFAARGLCRRLARRARPFAADTGRVIFISSTGVYGEDGGAWVDEDSPCDPTRESAGAMIAAEGIVASTSPWPSLHRAAHGGHLRPRPTAPQARHLSGKPVPARSNNWINLIHVDDAVSAVLAAESLAKPPRVYLISDGHPVDRRECFRYLAKLLGVDSPQMAEPSPEFLAEHHSGSSKRVNNARMRAELAIELKFPSYREGLAALVHESVG